MFLTQLDELYQIQKIVWSRKFCSWSKISHSANPDPTRGSRVSQHKRKNKSDISDVKSRIKKFFETQSNLLSRSDAVSVLIQILCPGPGCPSLVGNRPLTLTILSGIYLSKEFSFNKQRWFSGRILACHAGGPGSIPGRCILALLRVLWNLFQVNDTEANFNREFKQLFDGVRRHDTGKFNPTALESYLLRKSEKYLTKKQKRKRRKYRNQKCLEAENGSVQGSAFGSGRSIFFGSGSGIGMKFSGSG